MEWHRNLFAGGALLVVMLCGCQREETPGGGPSTRPSGAARSTLPDGRRIDTFSYAFLTTLHERPDFEPWRGGPSASLAITRDGKVYYSYATEPHTGSGGLGVSKEWTIPADEAERVLDGLVEDGLLELESRDGSGHGITVTYGRWRMTASPRTMPAQILTRLRPYLDEGEAAFRAKYRIEAPPAKKPGERSP